MSDIPQMTLEHAWQILRDDPAAVLVDVRTNEEWRFVGLPDLSSIGKEAITVSWTTVDGRRNADFVEAVRSAVDSESIPVLLLCRSGARSQAAAEELAGVGFSQCANVAAGFEGDLDGEAHRSGGWKSHGLPWRQT